MQFAGIWFWMRHYDPEKGEVIKRKLSWKMRVVFLFAFCLVWCGAAWALGAFSARSPWLDSATTVLSVCAMVLGVMRCFEQWFCWTLVNSVSILMWYQVYRESGNSLATLLMWVIFLLCGLYFGWCWHKEAESGKA
jgi:nicotinamide mononucleotide transporter